MPWKSVPLKSSALQSFVKITELGQTLGFVSHGKNSWNIKCLCLFVNTYYSPYTHSLLMSLSQRKHKTYIDLNCLPENSIFVQMEIVDSQHNWCDCSNKLKAKLQPAPSPLCFFPKATNSLNVDRIFARKRKNKICPQITQPIISSPSFSKHNQNPCFWVW